MAPLVIPGLRFAVPAAASDIPAPTSVTIVGSLQDELGCPGDWQPECSLTHLASDADDDVWQAVFDVPAGNFEYKATLDDSFDVNYGANAQQNGPNIPLALSETTSVKFYYSHETHWVTDNQNATIATAVGSFQSELGCPGDWQPDCLRSWLQDPDGVGTYAFTATLQAGSYEVKVAIDESFAENYGANGEPNGANIPFDVPTCGEVTLEYDASTHLLTVSVCDNETEAAALVEALIEYVGGIPSKPLLGMLRDALQLLDGGDIAAAIAKLEDALRYTAAQEGRRLTGAEADEVRASIEEILQLLE
jgi:hypothetical protein